MEISGFIFLLSAAVAALSLVRALLRLKRSRQTEDLKIYLSNTDRHEIAVDQMSKAEAEAVIDRILRLREDLTGKARESDTPAGEKKEPNPGPHQAGGE